MVTHSEYFLIYRVSENAGQVLTVLHACQNYP